ncbi:proliferating cell nuclear antigen (pcna) [Candidatus Pacearchaeota archaeon]|nr:proliferating cell nuclear antigen (pcna) [Candidatus Pacearchaeota archaeon]
MRLTLAEPKYLKDSISIISDLVNEARFKVTPEAMELVAMDPANVAMVIFKLLGSAFTEYDVKDPVEIAINLSNLKQILRRASPNDMLTLELGPENKLKVELKGNTKRTFNLPIIELEEKEQKIPDLKFPVTITTSSTILSESIEDVDIVAESVTFMADKDKFSINAEGDLSQANIEVKAGDNTKIKVEGDEKIKSKYSIEYLKKMMGASKLSDEVSINFNKDYPLKLEYKKIDKLMLSFILAPRVENE